MFGEIFMRSALMSDWTIRQ